MTKGSDMKKLFLGFVVCAMALSSCTSAYYYQLVNTVPGENLKQVGDNVLYEDENCVVSYDLWSDGGSMRISFLNKTDEDIYLDMSSSVYYENGRAYDLSGGSEASLGSGAVRTSTVPAGMYKVIDGTGARIQGKLYRDCNLLLAPSVGKVASAVFSKSDSPLVFGYRLCYYKGRSDKPVMVKNEFYVDRITNYPWSMFGENYLDKSHVCPDEKAYGKYRTKYLLRSPSAYYLEYLPSTYNSSNSNLGKIH